MRGKQQIADEIATLMRDQAVAEARQWGLLDVEEALAIVEALATVNTTSPGEVASVVARARKFYTANGGEL